MKCLTHQCIAPPARALDVMDYVQVNEMLTRPTNHKGSKIHMHKAFCAREEIVDGELCHDPSRNRQHHSRRVRRRGPFACVLGTILVDCSCRLE